MTILHFKAQNCKYDLIRAFKSLYTLFDSGAEIYTYTYAAIYNLIITIIGFPVLGFFLKGAGKSER